MRKLNHSFNIARMIFILSALIISVGAIDFTEAQSIDNKGNEFIMSFLTGFGGETLELHLTGDVNTTVTIDYPVNSPTFTTTVNVTPGTITIVEIPIAASQGWVPGTIQNNSVRAKAPGNTEFVCYMTNIQPFTSDAALALPVDSYNNEFIALTYNSIVNGGDRSMFTVTAAFNNTTVTITPKNALVGGFPAGVPFNITLNKGEGLQARGLTFGASGDLSGSIIESDKPVTVVNGNICTNVPPFQTFCDHIFEVAQPTQSWGDRVLVGNLVNNPNGSVYRIIASEDNTSILLDGAAFITLNRGDVHDTGLLTGNHEFTSDKPMFICQFMTGVNPGLGDPAQCNMVPPEQYQDAYVFSTVGGNQYAQHFINVFAQNDNVGFVMLDGSAIPAGDFTAIGATGYSFANISITEGTHSTSSPDGHGLVVFGVNEDDSYMYPGGALFNFINPGIDLNPPICQVSISGNIATGTATDNGPDDTGIFFVVLEPGSVNLNLQVDPFTPGEPIVTFTVSLIDPNQNGSGIVTATDGSGNTCSSPIQLGGGVVTPFMTIWAVSDNGDGKLYWYSLTRGVNFLNIEGDILGITGGQDVEDLIIDNDGTFYLVNNVGTSTIYKFHYNLLDMNSVTPVPVNLVGSTGLAADPNVYSPDEISSLLAYGGNLYGLSLGAKKLYTISKTDGSITHVADLNVAGDFRSDGMALAEDGIVYLLKSYTDGTESEIWKFDQFPGGDVSYVRQIETSGKVEALTAHPDGFLYASDEERLFQISTSTSYIGYLADYLVDIEGMDYFYELERTLDAVPIKPFTPIIGTDVKNPQTVPTEYGLTQNYPNPFNPSTTIIYSIPEYGNVNLSIYNLLGEVVATLIDENKAPGHYSVQFDAKNLPSGVYIYKLVTSGFTQSMKMMLMK